jgi:hypothetical protein
MSEGSVSDVLRNVTSQFLNEILNDSPSAPYMKKGLPELKAFMSVDGWCVAVLTAQIVRWYQILCLYEIQKFLRPSLCLCHVCNGVPEFRNATVSLTIPISLPLYSSTTNNISRNVCGFFEKLTWKLILHWSLITIASALHQTTLHLRYHLAEYFL